MKQKIATLFIAFLAFAVLFVGDASAYRGDYDLKGPYATEERCGFMHEALATGDYAAWKELKFASNRSSRLAAVVNEEFFPLFVEMHTAKKSGDYKSVATLRAELNLADGIGITNGSGFGKQNEREKSRGMFATEHKEFRRYKNR